MSDSDALAAHAAACGFFARIFRPGLDRDLLRRCAADRLAANWPLGDAGPGLELLGEALDGLDAPALEVIERDNTALFIGPENPLPMWESVWTTRERLLFADCEAAVARDFALAGFVAPEAGRAPADHLAQEFGFLAALLARAAEAAAAGDEPQARRHLAEAAGFFDRHPRRWAAECLAELRRRAATPFYRAAALLAADCLAGLPRLFAGQARPVRYGLETVRS